MADLGAKLFPFATDEFLALVGPAALVTVLLCCVAIIVFRPLK
jgi:hypothetical protein